MSKTLRIEGQVRCSVLMKDSVFQMESAHPLLEYPYQETDKQGTARDRLDRLVVIRYIRDGEADEKPSIAWMRDMDWKAYMAELQAAKTYQGIDPTDLSGWFVVMQERSVRIYEKR
jgi:hypothetical protein